MFAGFDKILHIFFLKLSTSAGLCLPDPFRGSAPGPRWRTSVPQTLWVPPTRILLPPPLAAHRRNVNVLISNRTGLLAVSWTHARTHAHTHIHTHRKKEQKDESGECCCGVEHGVWMKRNLIPRHHRGDHLSMHVACSNVSLQSITDTHRSARTIARAGGVKSAGRETLRLCLPAAVAAGSLCDGVDWKCRTWKCKTNVVLIATWRAVDNGAFLLYLAIKLIVMRTKVRALSLYMRTTSAPSFESRILMKFCQSYSLYWRRRPITTLSKRPISVHFFPWIHICICQTIVQHCRTC